uniref:hypothetical protein n=1 Tax=Methanobrevibacter sp. TaxID=66852 RepID=UPI00386FB38B
NRKSDYVIVYNPRDEQRKEILQVMDFDGESKVSVEGLRLLGLIERLTNIDLGLESGELTVDEALDVINNPNAMLQAVAQVVNSILINILKEQLMMAEEIAQLPEPVKRSILDETINKEKREEEAKKQAEIEELEAKLKTLRGE